MQVTNIIQNKSRSFFIILNFIVFTISLIWFELISLNRLIAKDEGFYAMAVEQVLKGRHPYKDFFYPQMPLLPYFYAGFNYFFELSFNSLRTITAIITTIISLIIFNIANNKLGLVNGLIILCIFLICNFNLMWFTVIQTYALSTLFLLSSVVLLEKSLKNNSIYFLILSSLLFSLSVSVRLYFAGLFPLLILYIFLNSKNRKNIITFTLWGLSFGLALTLYHLIDFDAFYFNNFTYHLNRSSKTFIQSLNNKKTILSVIYGFKDSVKFTSYHVFLLNYIVIFGLILYFFRKITLPLALYIIFGFLILNLIPNPSYVQYFCVNTPFIFLFIIDFLSKNNNKVNTFLLFSLMLLFIPGIFKDIESYTRTGTGVIGISNKANAKHWNLNNINIIQTKLNENCNKKKCNAITFWPGYLIGTKVTPLSGYENHFASIISEQISEEEKIKYKVRGTNDILNLVNSKNPDFIILNQRVAKIKKNILLEKGYNLIYSKKLIKIFSLNQELQGKVWKLS